MIARIIQWIRQGGRRYPQSSSPFGGTLGNNVGGIVKLGIGGMEFLYLSSPARTSFTSDSPVSAGVTLLSPIETIVEGDSQA